MSRQTLRSFNMYRFILLFLSFCFFVEGTYTEIENQAVLPILTPSFKEQETAKIELENGLKVLLISDPNAELSGAMMSVNVGSWEDPEEHPGLAHFLEHMLFLGTTKYPVESEYQSFINEHGGQANAFTTSNTTNYLFTIQSDAFKDGFSRFSSFFGEPLFNPSGVKRELNAIDQEYGKNIENDSIRLLYVAKDLTSKEHPFSHFNMGNSDSLKNASRDILKKFYEEHYSAHLMRLFVYSSLPINEMKELVNKELRDVQRVERDAFKTKIQAFGSNLEGKYIFIEPIKDSRTLSIFWELPAKYADLKDEQPEAVISFVLGHEGENSLLAQLKRENLAETLACGGSKLGDTLFTLYLEIELTNQGLQDIDQVITRTFQSINRFKEKGVPRYLFDEIRTVNQLGYQYQSKQKEFMMLMKSGFNIQDEAFESYPEKTHVIQTFDPGIVQKVLKKMTPENARFFVMAPSKDFDKKEPWLGVNYKVVDIPSDTFHHWQTANTHAEIDLPKPNEFLPKNLKLFTDVSDFNPKKFPEPITLIDNDHLKFYYAQDLQFGLPKVSWTIHVLTPKITLENPSDVVYGDLYVKFLKENLNKISYSAKVAGLEYDIKNEKNGIKITVNGFSDGAPLLLKKIFQEIVLFEPTEEKFKIYKDSLSREYRNFAKNSPLQQALELFKSMLYEDFVTSDEKSSAMRKISFKNFGLWANELFYKSYVEAMLYGNLTQEQAKDVIVLAEETFNNGAYPKSEHFENKVLILPEDQGPYYLESRTKSQGNVTLLGIENPLFSFKNRAAQQILMQSIEQPFYSTLRTKQQTGYIVFSFGEETERKLFNFFTVQSNTHDNRDLLSRFEAFIEGYLHELGISEMTEDQFDNIKASLLKKLEEPANNIKEMGELLDHILVNYDGDFNWMQKRAEGMKSLTYEQQLSLTRDFLGRKNKQRLAILLNGEIPEDNEFSYSKARTWNMIRKISQYEPKSNGSIFNNHSNPGTINGYQSK